jgi:hypothetical protein
MFWHMKFENFQKLNIFMKFEKRKLRIIKDIAFKFIVQIQNLKYYIWVFEISLKFLTQTTNNYETGKRPTLDLVYVLIRPTLEEGPRSNFLGTNWILELDYTLVPSLILGSPNQELSF